MMIIIITIIIITIIKPDVREVNGSLIAKLL